MKTFSGKYFALSAAYKINQPNNKYLLNNEFTIKKVTHKPKNRITTFKTWIKF